MDLTAGFELKGSLANGCFGYAVQSSTRDRNIFMIWVKHVFCFVGMLSDLNLLWLSVSVADPYFSYYSLQECQPVLQYP